MATNGNSLTRQDLERMKRADIQKICKDYGVKANMKTEALIELLLDTMRSNISPLVRPPPSRPPPNQPAPPPPPTMIPRRVSTRSRTSSKTSTTSGTRTRGTSGSSVVVHDTGDEAQSEYSSATAASNYVASSSRNRKAKETQLRLGVGRPVIAGGQGARAVTRSTSLAKGKRTKVGRNISVRPTEETIEEEPELRAANTVPATPTVNNLPSPLPLDPQAISRLSKLEALFNEANIIQRLNAMNDLPTQIAWLKASLEQREMEIMNVRGELQACRMEVMLLRGEATKIPALENQLRALKENYDSARASGSGSPNKVTQRRVSIPFAESNTNAPVAQGSPAKTPGPGPTETTLGKRHRDSGSSVMSGVTEAGEGGPLAEKDLMKRILRPSRKRTKTNEADAAGPSANPSGNSGESAEQESADESATGSSAPSTANPIGTPPPTNHLPEYFADSIDAIPHTPKNFEQYPTDNGLLGFSFSHAASSTPRDDIFGMNGGPEPFSPGSAVRAAARSAVNGSNNNSNNNSGLQPGAFGHRRTGSRPRTPMQREDLIAGQYGGSPLGGYDETTDFVFQFTQASEELSRRQTNSLPLPINLGFNFAGTMGAPPLGEGDSPERPTTQRTMYGTEYQTDTRFGEFGRDGIGNNTAWLNTGMF